MNQPQELGLRAQVLDVVPPGPIHRNRRNAVAKFSHRIPNFRDPSCTFSLVPDLRASVVSEQATRKKDEMVSRMRQQQQEQRGPDVKVPLLLEQRPATAGTSGPPAAVFKGAPEAGGGANMDGPPLHYILYRSGNRVTAFPAEQWFAFKPHVDRRGLLDSVAAANAAAGRQPPVLNAASKGGAPLDPFALRLVPKSQRLEKQRQEEEARERQEQVAAGRLLPLAGAVDDELGGRGGGRLKRFVDEDELEEELFGDDDEDEGPRFGGKGGKGAKKGRSRSIKTADGEELGEDEVPEDLYAGPAADEDLRPEKPEEAEDWEHEFEPDDDDQDQGHDEVYEDDPGMRKKLGIEADDEDEGEEADEQARKLKKLGDPDDSDQEEERKKKEEEEEAKRQQAAAGAAAAAGGLAAGEGDEQGEEDEDELDELDEMEEEPKTQTSPQPPQRQPSVPPAAAKPPPAQGAAVAAAAAGTKRKVSEESRPAADGTKRARTATPPLPQPAAGATQAGPVAAAARPAAAGAAPAAGASAAALSVQRPAQGAPAAAAAGGGGGGAAGPAVTAEEVIELLRRQPNGIMPFQDFTRYFAKRTTTPELRAGLKGLTVSLCKSSKNEAGQLLVSLKK